MKTNTDMPERGWVMTRIILLTLKSSPWHVQWLHVQWCSFWSLWSHVRGNSRASNLYRSRVWSSRVSHFCTVTTKTISDQYSFAKTQLLFVCINRYPDDPDLTFDRLPNHDPFVTPSDGKHLFYFVCVIWKLHTTSFINYILYHLYQFERTQLHWILCRTKNWVLRSWLKWLA